MRRIAALVALLTATQSSTALACACCAERGTRMDYEASRDHYSEGEFGYLAASGPAHVFMTACGEACIKGIDDPQDSYPVTLHLEDWQMRLQIDGQGALILPFAETYRRTLVDLDPFDDPEREPVLHSEFIFRGALQADGTLAAADGQMAELVLIGQSNMCWTASDMTHWSLSVAGDAAAFQLFGQLGPAE